MVRREQLINAIRTKGFGFKRQAERVDIWKQSGSTKRVMLPRRDLIEPKNAAFILKGAGFAESEIKRFLSECNQ